MSGIVCKILTRIVILVTSQCFYNNGDEGNNGDDLWQCNVTYRILDQLGENVAHTQKILRILRMHIARNIWHTCSQSAQNIWYIHTKYDISCTQNTPNL